MKKRFLVSALICSAALTLGACSEDSTDSPMPPEEQKVVVPATMACIPADCQIKLKSGATGGAIVSLVRGENEFVQDAILNVEKTGTGFSLINGPQLTTNNLGRAALSIKGETAGTGTVVFTYPLEDKSVTFNITVEQEEEKGNANKNDVTVPINVIYAGDLETVTAAGVLMFEGKSCADAAPEGLDQKGVSQIRWASFDLGTQPLERKQATFKFTTSSDNTDVYAAVALSYENDAYGCTDGVKADSSSVSITMKDAKVSEGEDNAKPSPEPTPDFEFDIRNYNAYPLTSRFNGFKLLPYEICDNGACVFKEYKLGNWIEFAFNTIANPGDSLKGIVVEQVLPLVLGSMTSDPTWGTIIVSLLDGLKVEDLIDDFITNITKNVAWFHDVQTGFKMVYDLATAFTLQGNFYVPKTADLSSGSINGIVHSYNAILYNNEDIANCYVGVSYGRDDDGKLICKINLDKIQGGSFSSAGSIAGLFDGQFNGSTATIPPHSMKLSYGKLIYYTLMEFVPRITGKNDITSIGSLIEYYAGYGAKAAWNSKNADDMIGDDIEGCKAVTTVLAKVLTQAIMKDGDSNGIGETLITTVIPSIVAPICSTKLADLDRYIVGLLDKLSYENNGITFASDACNYTSNGNLISAFGSKASMCQWKINVSYKDDKNFEVPGEFYAVSK